ncbi:MAG: hypothetical protein KKA62_00340 [Nanoarchaeota archaeon]|nr:hypothetical protein [Nanoarchaeota archaeon]MBU1643777.1 hypothetical protein [Nanoarchaeota archaeon]MBU1976384.1 hypothetical protein [Nanoarchaeota archaeon]
MSKRGQVTVFLVVGIVILLLSAAMFFIFSKVKTTPLEVEEKEAFESLGVKGQIQSYVESCMRETADPSVYLLASQGGIIYPEEDSKILLTDYGMINYAWINGVKGLSREKMEKDLGLYLEEYIDFCLGNFDTFLVRNIIVEPDYDKMKADFKIQDNFIDMQLNFPLKVTLPNGDELVVETFSSQLESRLGLMLKAVEALEMPDFDFTELISFPYQPVVFPYDESVMIYSLADEKNLDTPLAFMFAVRNDYPENKPPVLDFIADKTFKVGNRWQEILTAEDPNNDLLTFSSDSDKFPIKEDGTIDVEMITPGIYKVIFAVDDSRGGKHEQEVTITIVKN